MRKDYIKTAFRRLIRNRTISFINILGLSLGLAATFLIMLFVFYETSHDSFHEKREQIYRVIQESEGHEMLTAQCSYPLGDVLVEQYPQIKEALRLVHLYNLKIKKNEEFIRENRFFCAENSFFDLFTTQVLKGNPSEFTSNPGNVVLTQSMAIKYFGETDVLGRELIIENTGEKITLNVSGVIKDFPENSSFRPDFIASIDLGLTQLPKILSVSDQSKYTTDYFKSNWGFGFFITFILADKNFDPQLFETEFRKIEEKYLENPESLSYHLQRMDDIYFNSSNILSGVFKSDNMSRVYIFSGVGILILLIACINYILLNTSQALERSKEIGVRKITGATRKALFNQILVESVIVTLIAFPIALILIEQFRPVIIRFMEKNFVQYNLSWELMVGFAAVLFIIIYLPGIFTMRYFSRINPVAAIRGNSKTHPKGNRGKKLLISIQFVIFLLLVTSSVGIFKQIYYSKNHKLGFNPENIIHFNTGNHPAIRNSYEAFKQKLSQHEDILSVSGGLWVPPTSSRMAVTMSRIDDPEQTINMDGLYVDKDFLKTLDIRLLKGKSLSDYGNNFTGKVILNETALKKLGLKDPVGKKVDMGEIVGIVEDFHYHSFRKKIPPLMLMGNNQMVREVLIKTSGQNQEEIKEYINRTWEEFTGASRIETNYLTDNFDVLYKNERRLAVLITFFAGLAILIAAMGLLGLTIFTLKKRTKEIAIRKVNGARVKHILVLISMEYVSLIFYALLVSVPLSYYFLTRWLQDFAYKTNLSWWIFFVAGILGLIISLATISIKTIRAANRNPVESLRYE